MRFLIWLCISLVFLGCGEDPTAPTSPGSSSDPNARRVVIEVSSIEGDWLYYTAVLNGVALHDAYHVNLPYAYAYDLHKGDRIWIYLSHNCIPHVTVRQYTDGLLRDDYYGSACGGPVFEIW